jgi:NADPH:quinone reductase
VLAVLLSEEAGALPRRWFVGEVPDPIPGSTEVLVEVAAAGLNHADLLMRQGRYVPSDASWAVGSDRVGFEMAGRIRVVGRLVTRWAVGDTVMAQTGGACAEYVVVPEALLMPTRGVPLQAAATLPSGLMTEYDALKQAGFRAGDSVLVTGGSSGVGRIGVQVARILGAASVIATTRDSSKAPLLRELGADSVVETSPRESGVELPWSEQPGRTVVLDHVGGDLLAAVVRSAPRGTRIIQIGRLGGATVEVDLDRLALQRISITGTTFRGRDAEELGRLVHCVSADPAFADTWGGLRSDIDSVHSFADAEQAGERAAAADVSGKVVLRPWL